MMPAKYSLILGLGSAMAFSTAIAADGCLLTPEELAEATGRAFSAGAPREALGTGEPQCVYAEKNNPNRRVIVQIINEKAQQRFESNQRLVNFGKDLVQLPGVGDAAFYSGTNAGVLVGNRAIIISTLRRGSEAKIESNQVAELLKKAAQRLK